MAGCMICPRQCGALREAGESGYCGASDELLVARIAKHPWEEPPISGVRGSGTVFFGGCNLHCVFCQNRQISRGGVGKRYSPEELTEAMLRLVADGAHNINLVTPTPYTEQLIPILREVRKRTDVPVVYNCGGYESVKTLRRLEGMIDVYLPDAKYYDRALAEKYANAPDYYAVAEAAIAEMLRQVGEPTFDGEGMLTRGVMLRHLVLPGARTDSIALLRALAKRFGTDAFLLSLMSQYTPDFAMDTPFRELHRRLTSFEYRSVAEVAEGLGFEGFFQERSSVGVAYTPRFGEE